MSNKHLKSSPDHQIIAHCLIIKLEHMHTENQGDGETLGFDLELLQISFLNNSPRVGNENRKSD